MKPTTFVKLSAEEIEIVDTLIIEGETKPIRIKIKHSLLKRVRWFYLFEKGNWCSRYTNSARDYYARCYIIVGNVIIN